MRTRLLAIVLLAFGLSACASALPNGAAPVSSLYSFNDTARFMLGDVCLPSVVNDEPVAKRANVPAVYAVEDTARPTWRAGPGGAVRVTQTGPRACQVTASRGLALEMRDALMREIEQSRSDFRLVDSVEAGSLITDTYCAPFPSGLTVLLETRTDNADNSSVLVRADASIRRDVCL